MATTHLLRTISPHGAGLAVQKCVTSPLGILKTFLDQNSSDTFDRPRPIEAKHWKAQTARSRRIVQSSDSEVSDSQPPVHGQDTEAFVLSDGSPDRRTMATPKSQDLRTVQPASGLIAPNPVTPLYADDEPWNIDDGSILTL